MQPVDFAASVKKINTSLLLFTPNTAPFKDIQIHNTTILLKYKGVGMQAAHGLLLCGWTFKLQGPGRPSTLQSTRITWVFSFSNNRKAFAMKDYFVNSHFKKFLPTDSQYPIVELVDGDEILFDISTNDDGVIDVAFNAPACGRLFTYDQLMLLLEKGKKLLEEEINNT